MSPSSISPSVAIERPTPIIHLNYDCPPMATDSTDGMRSRKGSLKQLEIPKSPGKEGEGKKGNGKLTEEEEEPLSPAARLFHQPHFNCHIIAIMGFGKRLDVDAVKTGLEATLLKHPRFSSILVFDEKKGRQKWVRTKVELANHLVTPDLELNMGMESPDKLVEDYASDLTKSTLDTSKPLWEIHLLNIKTSEAEATAVLRIHHSLGDGASLMSLVLACTRKTSDADSPPTIPDRKPPVWRSDSLPFLAILWAVFRLVWNTFVDVSLFLATAFFLKDTETPLKGTKGVEHQPKRVVHRTLSLDEMKTVKNATDSTINDVLLGMTAAGLSRYLCRQYGKDKAKDEGKHSLPASMRLRAAVLVNIRPTPKIQASECTQMHKWWVNLSTSPVCSPPELRIGLPEFHAKHWMMHLMLAVDFMHASRLIPAKLDSQALTEMMEGGGANVLWGNRLGYMLVPFSTETLEDPLDCIRNSKTVADRKKLSLEALLTYWSGFMIVKCFGIKAGAALCHRVLSNSTLSFSNVVGPMEEISFYGHPLVYIAPTVYGHPHALTIHFQSYMNMVKVVIAVDENTIPDPHQLCDDIANSLMLMKDAAEIQKKAVG